LNQQRFLEILYSALFKELTLTEERMAEIDTTEIDAQIDNDKRLNKAEKKARKALAKLGLKPVANVSRVTMKRPPNILFYIGNPEVFKSPAGGGQETYVVYGVCQVDDGQRKFQQPPAQFPGATGAGSSSNMADTDDWILWFA